MRGQEPRTSETTLCHQIKGRQIPTPVESIHYKCVVRFPHEQTSFSFINPFVFIILTDQTCDQLGEHLKLQ